jgi:hypothetical protein
MDGLRVSLRRVSRGTEHPSCSRQGFGIQSALAGRRDTIIEAADGSDPPRRTSNARPPRTQLRVGGFLSAVRPGRGWSLSPARG